MRKKDKSMSGVLIALLIVAGAFVFRQVSEEDNQEEQLHKGPSYSHTESATRHTIPKFTIPTHSTRPEQETAAPVKPTVPVPTKPEPTRPAPTRPAPTESGGNGYVDSRVPNYVPENPSYTTKTYKWESHDKRWKNTFGFQINTEMYQYYRNLPRYTRHEDYYHFVNDPNNRVFARDFVAYLKKYADQWGFDQGGLVREAVKFVQDVIAYETDLNGRGVDEFPKYPIETIYDGKGDCEDTSFLLASILKEMGYDVGILEIPGHMAVAVKTTRDYNSGSYYEFNGERYLYIESTGSNWEIGKIPEEHQNQKATFYRIP